MILWQQMQNKFCLVKYKKGNDYLPLYALLVRLILEYGSYAFQKLKIWSFIEVIYELNDN